MTKKPPPPKTPGRRDRTSSCGPWQGSPRIWSWCSSCSDRRRPWVCDGAKRRWRSLTSWQRTADDDDGGGGEKDVRRRTMICSCTTLLTLMICCCWGCWGCCCCCRLWSSWCAAARLLPICFKTSALGLTGGNLTVGSRWTLFVNKLSYFPILLKL